MSDFYLEEIEKSKWISEGIRREKQRIIEILEEVVKELRKDITLKEDSKNEWW